MLLLWETAGFPVLSDCKAGSSQLLPQRKVSCSMHLLQVELVTQQISSIYMRSFREDLLSNMKGQQAIAVTIYGLVLWSMLHP